MHKSISFWLIGSLVILLPFGTSSMNISNANAIADSDSDQYERYAMDMGSNDDNNYYYKSNDYDNVLVNNNIKCNNINVNVNGFNGVEIGTLTTALRGLASDKVAEENTDTSSFTGNGDGSEINSFKFVCINNNNNIAVEGEEPSTPPNPTPAPQTSFLTVKKEVFVCNEFTSGPAYAIMMCDQGPDPDNPLFPWINCELPSSFNFPSICQGLSENLFDIQVLGPQNNLIDEFVGPENGMTFDNLQPGTYTVEERKYDDNVNKLGIEGM